MQGNDAPALATGIVEDDIGKSRLLGVEDQAAIALSQAFDRQFAIQDGDDDSDLLRPRSQSR